MGRKSIQRLVLLIGKHIHDIAHLRQDNKGEIMPFGHQNNWDKNLLQQTLQV